MTIETLGNAFAFIGIAFCVFGSLMFLILLVGNQRSKAFANRESAEDLLIQQIVDASSKPLSEAVPILVKAGLSYDASCPWRACRWEIPKVFWQSGKFAAKKAKALDTVIVAAKRCGKGNSPELDLYNVLMGQAKKNPLAVIMISCALTRFNQDFKNWFDRE